jgi:hypothetical protein
MHVQGRYLDATGPPSTIVRDLKEEGIAISADRPLFLLHSLSPLIVRRIGGEIAFSISIFVRRDCDAEKIPTQCCKHLTDGTRTRTAEKNPREMSIGDKRHVRVPKASSAPAEIDREFWIDNFALKIRQRRMCNAKVSGERLHDGGGGFLVQSPHYDNYDHDVVAQEEAVRRIPSLARQL